MSRVQANGAQMTQSTNSSTPRTERSPLSDDDIALLCDVGDSFPAKLDGDKNRRLQRLTVEGFVELASAAKAPEKYWPAPGSVDTRLS
jgi:hypothetical protein